MVFFMTAQTVNKRKKSKVKNQTVVSTKVKDYGKSPFFVKKAKEAEVFIKKIGLPNSSI
jgi:hypothetical protein